MVLLLQQQLSLTTITGAVVVATGAVVPAAGGAGVLAATCMIVLPGIMAPAGMVFGAAAGAVAGAATGPQFEHGVAQQGVAQHVLHRW